MRNIKEWALIGLGNTVLYPEVQTDIGEEKDISLYSSKGVDLVIFKFKIEKYSYILSSCVSDILIIVSFSLFAKF